jgi:hypothetical protein
LVSYSFLVEINSGNYIGLNYFIDPVLIFLFLKVLVAAVEKDLLVLLLPFLEIEF